MVSAGAVIHHLLLTYRSRQEFLTSYSEERGSGTLFVPGHLDIPIGRTVDLEIAFADDLMVFHSQGLVVECVPADVAAGTPGLRVAFMDSELSTRNLMLEYARGINRQAIRRRSRRFPVHIDIEYTTESTFVRAVTQDLNREGAFILTQDLLDAGTLLAVRLYPPAGGEPILVTAEVCRRQRKPQPGLGIRFLTGDPVKQQQIRDLVEQGLRLASDVAGDKKPPGGAESL